MFAAWRLKRPALDDVEEMRDDAGLGEELAIGVEVDAQELLVPSAKTSKAGAWMETPVAGIDRHALAFRSAGLADFE